MKTTDTTKIIKSLTNSGYNFIHDITRDLYIGFKLKDIYDEITRIRNWFNGKPDEKIEGSNCTNSEALRRLDTLENIIKFLTTNSENI